MNVHDILVRARHSLDLWGLHKGDFGTDCGPKCAMGHIRYAVSAAVGSVDGVYECYAAEERLRMNIDPSLGRRSIVPFNDGPTTTLLDVRAAFDRAIEASKSA